MDIKTVYNIASKCQDYNEFKAIIDERIHGIPMTVVSDKRYSLVDSDSISDVSDSTTFSMHHCINEILKTVDRYRYSSMSFVEDERIRCQVQRAIEKNIYCR